MASRLEDGGSLSDYAPAGIFSGSISPSSCFQQTLSSRLPWSSVITQRVVVPSPLQPTISQIEAWSLELSVIADSLVIAPRALRFRGGVSPWIRALPSRFTRTQPNGHLVFTFSGQEAAMNARDATRQTSIQSLDVEPIARQPRLVRLPAGLLGCRMPMLRQLLSPPRERVAPQPVLR